MNRDRRHMEDVGEFAFIRSIMKDCLCSGGDVIQAIGDDCAVIGPYGGKVLLITTDLLIEDVHFMMGKIPPTHLGEKAVAVNLSDIAAMGGKPRHLFVSLAVPSHTAMGVLRSLYDGMKEMCRRYRVSLLGGDTSSSPRGLFINVTVVGEAVEDEVLYRKGASPGDHICVTGTLGDSALGLKLLKGELSAPEKLGQVFIDAQNRPVPQLKKAGLIAQSGLATSMIDISDGLVSDLDHICAAGHVGARIFRERLPLSREMRTLCRAKEMDPYSLAISGGEDYQLLFTVRERHVETLNSLFRKKRMPVPVDIGEITAVEGITCIRPDGSESEIRQKGFDHFRPS
jgi:thiamine-monophosphate kinase